MKTQKKLLQLILMATLITSSVPTHAGPIHFFRTKVERLLKLRHKQDKAGEVDPLTCNLESGGVFPRKDLNAIQRFFYSFNNTVGKTIHLRCQRKLLFSNSLSHHEFSAKIVRLSSIKAKLHGAKKGQQAYQIRFGFFDSATVIVSPGDDLPTAIANKVFEKKISWASRDKNNQCFFVPKKENAQPGKVNLLQEVQAFDPNILDEDHPLNVEYRRMATSASYLFSLENYRKELDKHINELRSIKSKINRMALSDAQRRNLKRIMAQKEKIFRDNYQRQISNLVRHIRPLHNNFDTRQLREVTHDLEKIFFQDFADRDLTQNLNQLLQEMADRLGRRFFGIPLSPLFFAPGVRAESAQERRKLSLQKFIRENRYSTDPHIRCLYIMASLRSGLDDADIHKFSLVPSPSEITRVQALSLTDRTMAPLREKMARDERAFQEQSDRRSSNDKLYNPLVMRPTFSASGLSPITLTDDQGFFSDYTDSRGINRAGISSDDHSTEALDAKERMRQKFQKKIDSFHDIFFRHNHIQNWARKNGIGLGKALVLDYDGFYYFENDVDPSKAYKPLPDGRVIDRQGASYYWDFLSEKFVPNGDSLPFTEANDAIVKGVNSLAFHGLKVSESDFITIEDKTGDQFLEDTIGGRQLSPTDNSMRGRINRGNYEDFFFSPVGDPNRPGVVLRTEKSNKQALVHLLRRIEKIVVHKDVQKGDISPWRNINPNGIAQNGGNDLLLGGNLAFNRDILSTHYQEININDLLRLHGLIATSARTALNNWISQINQLPLEFFKKVPLLDDADTLTYGFAPRSDANAHILRARIAGLYGNRHGEQINPQQNKRDTLFLGANLPKLRELIQDYNSSALSVEAKRDIQQRLLTILSETAHGALHCKDARALAWENINGYLGTIDINPEKFGQRGMVFAALQRAKETLLIQILTKDRRPEDLRIIDPASPEFASLLRSYQKNLYKDLGLANPGDVHDMSYDPHVQLAKDEFFSLDGQESLKKIFMKEILSTLGPDAIKRYFFKGADVPQNDATYLMMTKLFPRYAARVAPNNEDFKLYENDLPLSLMLLEMDIFETPLAKRRRAM